MTIDQSNPTTTTATGATDLTLRGLTTRLLDSGDLAGLMTLSRESAAEAGVLEHYCANHNRAHLEGLLERGTGIGVCEGAHLIGAALFTQIDTGIALLDDMESAHIFVRPGCRGLHVARALFRAIRQFSEATGRTMLVHQVSYWDALAGRKIQTGRVEKLYKRMIGDGSYGITYVCRPGRVKAG